MELKPNPSITDSNPVPFYRGSTKPIMAGKLYKRWDEAAQTVMLRLSGNADRRAHTYGDQGVSPEDARRVGLISCRIQRRMTWSYLALGKPELWHSPWAILGKVFITRLEKRENFSILVPGVMGSIRKKVLTFFENFSKQINAKQFCDNRGNRTITQEI